MPGWRTSGVEQTRVASLIAGGRVVLNGEPVRKSYRPRAGDVLLVDLPPLPVLTVEPEPIPVPVVFEDDVLLVVDKPAGLVVHPAPGTRPEPSSTHSSPGRIDCRRWGSAAARDRPPTGSEHQRTDGRRQGRGGASIAFHGSLVPAGGVETSPRAGAGSSRND